jgi:hypothetical protein
MKKHALGDRAQTVQPMPPHRAGIDTDAALRGARLEYIAAQLGEINRKLQFLR